MVLKVSLNTGINRIRLEFKGRFYKTIFARSKCINRIRLEFKEDETTRRTNNRDDVLIESDWNLKDDKNYVKNYATSINRIRLEFKALTELKMRVTPLQY